MPINTSPNKTSRYSRFVYGDSGQFGRRNILAVSFVANDLQRPAVAGTTQLMPATAISNTAANTYIIAPNPDVPRNIVVTIGGTVTGVPAGNVVITGINVEGATITESLTLATGVTQTLTGTKAFKIVARVTVPQATAAGATIAVGYGARLGIGMRNMTGMPLKIWRRAVSGVEALEDASFSAFSPTVVENNVFTPTTAPNGTTMYRVYVLNYKWALNPTNAQPDYGV